MSVLDASQPFDRYFEEISAIPRGSLHEEGMVKYLIRFADAHGLKYYTDEYHNVVIYKNASPGYELAPTVILQAHTDMVCAAKSGVKHDFEKEGIELIREGNIVRANGTTLGADDGTGVATMLGLLDDESLRHPALEALFTAAEEIGMIGASMLNYSVLKGRRLISMDSGGKNETSVNSAAFEQINLSFPYTESWTSGDVCRLIVQGLQGGHSGAEIDKERENAIKVAAAFLRRYAETGIEWRMVSIRGGCASNVIPYECEAIFVCSQGEVVEHLTQVYANELRKETGKWEPGLSVVLEVTGKKVKAMTHVDSVKLMDLLTILPSGRRHISIDIPDFVTASSNLAVVRLENGMCQIKISVRAATDRLMRELHDEILAIARNLQVLAVCDSQSPCWIYEGTSELRSIAAKLMPEVLGKDLIPSYEHGGMETGYFAKNIPGVDIYVIGPVGREVHTPDEWMDLDSCHRVYEFMKQYLALLR